MTEQQLTFCKKCTHRKFNPEKGLLCGLTDEKPTFTGTCNDFSADQEVVDRLHAQTSGVIDRPEVAEVVLSQEQIEKFKSEQNLTAGLVAGSAMALIGAFIWGQITVATGYQIGYMAIGLAFLVGMAIRFFGKGIDPVFNMAGAVISVLGVFVGNFLSVIGFVANYSGMGFLETLNSFDIGEFFPIMMENFSIIDIVFYVIAASTGYKLSARNFTEEDIQGLKGGE